MSQIFSGHYDGKVIILESPGKIPVGKRLRIQISVDAPKSANGTAKPRKIVGAGQFASGISDLGSNKRHLEGFGKS